MVSRAEVEGSTTVTVRLSGGLGNQLFQYAAGKALSNRLRGELVLDTSAFGRTEPGVTPRAFALDRFRFQGTVGATPPLRWPLRRALASRKGPVAALARQMTNEFHETTDAYDPAFERLSGSTVLQGYFQSYRYFQNVADAIATEVEDLVSPTTWFHENMECLEETPNSVSIHIRRGDYLIGSNSQFHGILPASYYSRALEVLAERLKLKTLFVFSDDQRIMDVPCQIKWPVTPVYVRPPASSPPIESLILMSRSNAIVAANSSFSWWGAWLGWSRKKALVVVPEPWLRASKDLSHDRSPEEWIHLSHRWQEEG